MITIEQTEYPDDFVIIHVGPLSGLNTLVNGNDGLLLYAADRDLVVDQAWIRYETAETILTSTESTSSTEEVSLLGKLVKVPADTVVGVSDTDLSDELDFALGAGSNQYWDVVEASDANVLVRGEAIGLIFNKTPTTAPKQLVVCIRARSRLN